MKRDVLIKGFLLIAILISIVAVTLDVKADAIVLAEPGNNTTTESGNNTDNSATDNTSANNTTTNNVGVSSTLTPTVNNADTNTNLPETGLEDNTMIYIVLGVSAVAAIYAYKKVRDYKEI